MNHPQALGRTHARSDEMRTHLRRQARPDVASSTAQMGRSRGRGPELNRVTLRTGVIVSTPESAAWWGRSCAAWIGLSGFDVGEGGSVRLIGQAGGQHDERDGVVPAAQQEKVDHTVLADGVHQLLPGGI